MARKELREELAALRKASGFQRAEIVALKKQVKVMAAQLNKMSRTKAVSVDLSASKEAGAIAQPTKGKPGRKVVFTPERLKAQRAKLGFTQEQMGKLLEVSGLSIWKWESGASAPRASRVPQILERLAMGKREAVTRVTFEET